MRYVDLAGWLEENVYTFEDFGEATDVLRRHALKLSKTEYDGDDKELLEQYAYELEKAKNVID